MIKSKPYSIFLSADIVDAEFVVFSPIMSLESQF